MKIAECRTCKAPVIWTTTTKGRRMPVDAEPVQAHEGGSLFRLIEDDDEVLAEYVPASQLAREPDLYVSHFATCPNADAHRGPR